MAFIPAADTAEVVMTYRYPNGNEAKNVYNVREANITAWDATTLNLLLDVFEDWETEDAAVERSSSVTCVKASARDAGAENGAFVERSLAIPGETANPSLPANVTFAVKCTTGYAGRSFRGRSFWIGLYESAVTGDFLDAGTAGAIVTLYGTLAAALLVNGWVRVIVSRSSNLTPRTSAVVTDIIAYSYVDLRVDTMRRRLVNA